jgi:CHAD domain-containing protein
MPDHVEREVKLSAPSGFHLPELGGVELPDRSFVSTYHDTQDLRLARHGVTFRHRIEDGTGLWQLKLPRGSARIELEEPGPPARPPDRLLGLLVGLLRGGKLVRVARLATRRRSVRADGAEVVDDSVSVLEGQRVKGRFRELEVELLEGDERSLRRLETALREAGAEPGVFEPKLYRVLELAYPPRKIELPADATPAETLGAALREQYERLLAHDPGTRLGDDPEDLHQMRVATRRSRAFLRSARPLLDLEWASSLRDELGWLGTALGTARDLDVLGEQLHAEVVALGERRARAESLLAGVERERSEAHAAVLVALSDERYFAFLDRLEASDHPPLVAGLGLTLTELWWEEFRRARRAFTRLGPGSSDAELHAARIRMKRARYAAELAAHELGDPGERFLKRARKLQDLLGEHQDAVVATARIADWVDEGGDREVADVLLTREDERRARARTDWPAVWKKAERKARRAKP